MVPGENWKKEVQTSKTGTGPDRQKLYDTRLNFYKDRVKNKLGETFDNIINDAMLKGYKTFEQHDGKSLEHKVKAGDTLFVILRDFYKSQFGGMDATQSEKEAYLSLAYLMKNKEGENVDELELGWNILIKNGLISITDDHGNWMGPIGGSELRPLNTVGATAQTEGERPRDLPRDDYNGPTGEELARGATIVGTQGSPERASAGQATVHENIQLATENTPEPAHITRLKAGLEAFNGQYELFENGTIIVVKSNLYPKPELRWNNSSKGWIMTGADLRYDTPEEAFADLLIVHEAEKLWTRNISKAEKDEDPFYLAPMKNFIFYNSEWVDESVPFEPKADKEKILAYINKLYKENVRAKEIQPSDSRPQESETGMKARDTIRATLNEIPLDFVFTVLSSTELQIYRMGASPVGVEWKEADQEWAFTYKGTAYSDFDLDYVAKTIYKLQTDELK